MSYTEKDITEEAVPEEAVLYDLPYRIRDAWNENKGDMSDQIRPGEGGVPGAVLRILALNLDVRELVLDEKSKFVASDQCRRYVKKIVRILDPQHGDKIGVGILLDILGVSSQDRNIWKERAQGTIYRQG